MLADFRYLIYLHSKDGMIKIKFWIVHMLKAHLGHQCMVEMSVFGSPYADFFFHPEL